MIRSRNFLIIALALPILALASMIALRQYVLTSGNQVVLPITGYDPRDLLSGHYLIYQIEYGVENLCLGHSGKTTGFVCLEPKRFSYSGSGECAKLIRGVCNNARFEAGIEKFFVPEEKALQLEQAIRSKTASVVLSLTTGGEAQVKDLLVDGRSWKDQ